MSQDFRRRQPFQSFGIFEFVCFGVLEYAIIHSCGLTFARWRLGNCTSLFLSIAPSRPDGTEVAPSRGNTQFGQKPLGQSQATNQKQWNRDPVSHPTSQSSLS